jgi:hypothetical protein
MRNFLKNTIIMSLERSRMVIVLSCVVGLAFILFFQNLQNFWSFSRDILNIMTCSKKKKFIDANTQVIFFVDKYVGI